MTLEAPFARAGESNTGEIVQIPAQKDLCLHELFERQAELNPEAIALEATDYVLTYAALDAKANQLAHFLRQQDIGPGCFIGLCMPRSGTAIIAILACLKAGAAYVPIDPAHPDARISFILNQANIRLILSTDTLIARLDPLFSGPVVPIEQIDPLAGSLPQQSLTRKITGLKPSDACYVLYTSGSTGTPKGVVAEHRNVVHFVTAFNTVCSTTTSDRVYQGFALTFDGSVEEMWMAFSNGAALIAGDANTPKFGDELADVLINERISFFSTVPTLLSTIAKDIPSLRQLVVSGEACPPDLVARWAKPGRTMLNVYGPTEATVNTTAEILTPGKAVTIGKPLDGYEIVILNEQQEPVATGAKGELYIGGPGISRGYLEEPELTKRAYVILPGFDNRRFYRTGDEVCWNSAGDLEFFGRIDTQVKIRGFRVELSEIEAVLMGHPDISNAVVTLAKKQDLQALAAYVVTEPQCDSLDRGETLETLKSQLPSYMVPAFLEELDTFPRLASGKVDRKQLPEPATPLVAESGPEDTPRTETESKVASIWENVFKIDRVGVNQDFFRDLGGHSLLAAQLVSALRNGADVHVAVRDIYTFPTIRLLADHADAVQRAHQTGHDKKPIHHAANLQQQHAKPGAGMIAIQLLFYFVLGPLLALPLVIVVPPVIDMLYFKQPIISTILFVILVGLCLWPLFIALGIAAKWILIGRYKPGAYPLWGSYYLRWWLATRLQSLSGLGAFGGTPLAPVMWRIMGAKVGKNCMLQTGLVSAWDCISIGDDTSIATDTQLPGARIENGYLIIGSVTIGDRCFVGAHSSLGLDVELGNDSRLDDQSALPDGHSIPAGQSMRGSPPVETDVPAPEGKPLRRSRRYLAWYCAGQITAAILTGLAFGLPFIVSGLALAFAIVHLHPAIWIPMLVALVPISVLIFCLYTALVKKILHPNPQPGTYEVYSFPYLQFWMTSGLLRLVRGAGLLIFTTIYLPPWMRLLGAKLGAHTEMSTVWSLYPEMVQAGDGVFFADGCILGGSRTHLGRFDIRPVIIGDRSFIGNSALVPPGSGLGNNSLLGVLSAPPQPDRPAPDNTDWLGSPGFQLPNRLIVEGFDDSVTYQPTRSLYMQRALIDGLRIFIPAYYTGILATCIFLLGLAIYNNYGIWTLYLVAPLIGWITLTSAVALTVGLKWTVMGRFHPVVVPLWSRYVWLNEMLNGVYETIMSPIIGLFYGTPFAAPLLRLMGCDIGKHCYIGASLVSEFDLVHVDDFAAINGGAIIQNHLFEDRVMKSSHLYVGKGCSVGNMSVVLYDTKMEENAVLGPMSLLMKGETMPAGNRWHGIPTVQE